MSRTIFVALASTLLAGTAAAQEECEFEARRSATVSVAGARSLLVEVGAGSLRVEGRPGLTEVRVSGRACASSEALLGQLDVNADRRGDVVRVTMPETDNRFENDEYARLHLVVEVPAGIEADISDGSGAAEIRGLGATRVHDGSGDLLLEDMSGLLEIEDGSGGIVVNGAAGDVVVEDGSGEIRIDDVRGSVSIEDGSGSVHLARVGRNARVDDSSGDIEVDGVGGDFIVGNDSSGSIRHGGVRGRVDVPRPRR
jgi:hypothetical protein